MKKKPIVWNGSKDLSELLIEVSELQEDPDNARLHPPANMEAIRNSLIMYGQKKPIVTWRNLEGTLLVLCGNGTYRAARELGWSHISVTEFEGTELQARAYAIVDNRTGELSQWHAERLEFQTGVIAQNWSAEAAGGVEWSAATVAFSVDVPPAEKPKKERTERAERPDPVLQAEIDRRASGVEAATIDVEVASEPKNRIEMFDLFPENEIHFDPDPDNGMLLIASDASGQKCFTVSIESSFMPTVVLRWERRTGLKIRD